MILIFKIIEKKSGFLGGFHAKVLLRKDDEIFKEDIDTNYDDPFRWLWFQSSKEHLCTAEHAGDEHCELDPYLQTKQEVIDQYIMPYCALKGCGLCLIIDLHGSRSWKISPEVTFSQMRKVLPYGVDFWYFNESEVFICGDPSDRNTYSVTGTNNYMVIRNYLENVLNGKLRGYDPGKIAFNLAAK